MDAAILLVVVATVVAAVRIVAPGAEAHQAVSSADTGLPSEPTDIGQQPHPDTAVGPTSERPARSVPAVRESDRDGPTAATIGSPIASQVDRAPVTTTTPPTTFTSPTTVPPTTTTTPPTTATATGALDVATAHLDPGDSTPGERMVRAYEVAVPQRWRTAAPASLSVIAGSTSWSHSGGSIEVGATQLDSWRHALYVLAHEWGHQAAFRFGTGTYLGAPPAGFPGDGSGNQAELWGECVAQALVGFRWPNPYPDCPTASLDWTRAWLDAGPPW